ncbi:MAG: DUF1244 domain-containing protein [Nevskia sp.]|nr:DUF1244 domain-containing protein [Nevskia sp.]
MRGTLPSALANAQNPRNATIEPGMDQQAQDRIEAAVFRRLLQHLDSRKDVQNIELMNLAGFCRNCLAKWYAQAAREQGVDVPDEAARERVYGMPYAEWKKQYQREATAGQQAAFDKTKT